MSATNRRHQTMQALVRGSPLFPGTVELSHVDQELGELGRCAKTSPEHRKRLLQVIHATRSLDTTLGVLLRHHGKQPEHGIGKRLHQLRTLPPHSGAHMTRAVAASYVAAICNGRNRYAHQANKFPTSAYEVDKLVAEVSSCLSAVL